MKTDLSIILNSVVKEAALFLRDDMKINILEIKAINDINLDDYIGVIKFIGSEEYIVIISMDDKIFEILFNKFFQDGVASDEKEELVNALPDEIINNVAGLAIRNFPLNCDDLELSLPVKIEKEKILELLDKNNFQHYKIITSDGDFDCSVIYNNKTL
ncbi:MAG: chemotaxis protein CheX [Arcobacteraceae bacterium]|nr:chemotaxis protein CheX [Arcobacteraceae bacterium]